MARQTHIDGFTPRRTARLAGPIRSSTSGRVPLGVASQPMSSLSARQAGEKSVVSQKAPSRGRGIPRADIDDALRGIQTDEVQPIRRKVAMPKTGRRFPKKKIILAIAAVLVLGVLGAGGWVAYKALIAGGSIFKGNVLLGLIQNQPLKEDKNGRSNILLLGTSEDDPGHGGAFLTDSMMIVSVDQDKKRVDMFSIPRDLYVKYGRACNSGYQGKINEYFNCVNNDWTTKEAEDERLAATRTFVGDIFGLDIQYAVHVNNTVIKQAVDAVGGVDVDIQGSNGDPGVFDRNFDWRCGYKCYLVKYDNGVHHLDGEHALFLAMARGDVAPTYGLGNSNFDREKNQQKIIIALKEKAISTGTLSDIGKVTKLIEALGDNLRTNIETSEIRTFAQLGRDVPTTSVSTVSLFGQEGGVVTTGSYGGASVVMPKAGIFDYSEIRTYLQKQLSSDAATKEGAKITVLNGSGVPGVAQKEADILTDAGLTVDGVDNAPAGKYADVEVYQLDSAKKATAAKLEKLLGVTVMTTKPPVAVTPDTSFVVVFGADRSAKPNR